MAGANDGHEVEGLVRALQGADDLCGAGGIDVGVQFADDEEEVAFEFVCIVHVAAPGVAVVNGPAHPLLVPPDLVHAVVVAAAVGDGDVIKVVVIEQRAHRTLSASTAAVDTHATEIHPRACLRGIFDPQLAIWEAGVLQVLPAHVVKGFATMIGAHAVELDDDEAEFGNRVMPEQPAELLRGEGGMWSGVDVLHDRILLRRIEIGGLDDDTVNFGFAVTSFGHEAFRHRPARGEQRGGIGLLQFAYEAAVFAAAQFGDGWMISTRPRVDEEVALG